MENMLLLPAPIRDALMRYLATRPWQEVHEVMPHLMSLQAAQATAQDGQNQQVDSKPEARQ